MPILNLEYTANLQIENKVKNFLLEVHHILVQEIKTDLQTCRSSVTKCIDFLIGDGDSNNAYIILRIQMLPGRTDEIKDRAGRILLQKIYSDFSDEINKYNTQVRIYLTETDKKYYYGLE